MALEETGIELTIYGSSFPFSHASQAISSRSTSITQSEEACMTFLFQISVVYFLATDFALLLPSKVLSTSELKVRLSFRVLVTSRVLR